MRLSLVFVACLLLSLGFFAGCQGESDLSMVHEGQQVPIAREFKGQQGPFPDAGYLVVQRQEVWQALWAGKPPAEIDFDKQTVLVPLLGQSPTAGYDVTISDVRATEKRITVFAAEKQPKPKEVVDKVISYPYHMVVVPKITQLVYLVIAGAKGQPFALQELYQGEQCNAVEATTKVVRDADAWQIFWTKTFGDKLAAPAVDFAQFMAVAVLLGRKPHSGYAVNITSATGVDDRLIVGYRTHAPLPDEQVAATTTSPYAIAILPTSATPVVFKNVARASSP